MSIFDRETGTVWVHVDRVGVHSTLAVPKLDPQPTGDFHVWFGGVLEVSLEPEDEDALPTDDFRERLDNKRAAIHFWSGPLPEWMAELDDQLVGVARAKADGVEGQIHTNEATLAYVANVATARAQNDVSQRLTIDLELKPLRPENQPKSDTVKGYAIVKANLSFNKGNNPSDNSKEN